MTVGIVIPRALRRASLLSAVAIALSLVVFGHDADAIDTGGPAPVGTGTVPIPVPRPQGVCLAGGPPCVNGISKTFGPASGGTSIDVYGFNFSSAVTQLWFGTRMTASFRVVDAGHIVATTPGGTPGTSVPVTVGVGPSSTGKYVLFTYGNPAAPAPIVTSVSPSRARTDGVTLVTITGSHLRDARAIAVGNTLVFQSNVTACGFQVVDDSRLVLPGPSGFGVGTSQSVVVTTSGGMSSGRDQLVYFNGDPVQPMDLTGPIGADGLPHVTMDPNGMLQDPLWAYQVYALSCGAPYIPATNNPGVCAPPASVGHYTCTNQHTWYTSDPICTADYVGPQLQCHADPQHWNWQPVTYLGRIWWKDFSATDSGSVLVTDDWDYNFYFAPENGGGVDEFNDPDPTEPPGSAPNTIHAEFNARELAGLYTGPWWSQLRYDPSMPGAMASDPHSLINGQTAVVTGLIGLDCCHNCLTELHPIFAWAMDESAAPDPSNDRWSLMARAQGDQGGCGHVEQGLTDSTGAAVSNMTLRIPWWHNYDGSDATAVSVTWLSAAATTTDAIVVTPVHHVAGLQDGVYVQVPMRLAGILLEAFTGEIQLNWAGAKVNPATRAAPSPAPRAVENDDVALGRALVSRLPPGTTLPRPAPAPAPAPQHPRTLVSTDASPLLARRGALGVVPMPNAATAAERQRLAEILKQSALAPRPVPARP
jgi:hypothetical protein